MRQFRITLTGCGCDPEFKRRVWLVGAPDIETARQIGKDAKANLIAKGVKARRLRVEEV